MGGGSVGGFALRLSFASAIAFSCSGCSFLFVSSPPSNANKLPPSKPVECTTSVAAPVLDTIGTAVEVVRTSVALGAKDSAYDNAVISRDADVGLGVAFGALFAVSAIYGFSSTRSCVDAKARHRWARPELESSGRGHARRNTRLPAAPPKSGETPVVPPVAPPTGSVPVRPPAPKADGPAAPTGGAPLNPDGLANDPWKE